MKKKYIFSPNLPTKCNAQPARRSIYSIQHSVSNLGSLQSKKYPFFSITGSGETGKTSLTQLIIDWIKSQNKIYLLTAPNRYTKCWWFYNSQSGSGYQSLAFYDLEFKKKLQAIQILIIDEIFMVSVKIFFTAWP